VISIENFLSPRHRFEMDIPVEIYAFGIEITSLSEIANPTLPV
jgi:hypothetical protein